MEFDYYDEDGGQRRWLRMSLIGLVSLAIAGGGIWTFGRAGNAGSPSVLAGAPTGAPVEPAATADSAATVASTATMAPGPTAEPSAPLGSTPATTATAAPSTLGTDPTTIVATTTAVEVSTAAAAPAGTGPGYPTSDDGTPLPIIVTYDRDVITITGFVPSEEAKDRLEMLATVNSKVPARVENRLVVNENVPIGVGVRVLELDSVRFPEGSADILPAHSMELERVARVMEALPNVTVLVVGHADQRGDEIVNFEISAARAAAVVDFLTYLGVSPTRLSSRAVGESDLLTLADDGTALALNRRTEFVFYGVFAG